MMMRTAWKNISCFVVVVYLLFCVINIYMKLYIFNLPSIHSLLWFLVFLSVVKWSTREDKRKKYPVEDNEWQNIISHFLRTTTREVQRLFVVIVLSVLCLDVECGHRVFFSSSSPSRVDPRAGTQRTYARIHRKGE